ncbi:DinB family protein [Simiduia litorea]
MNGTSHFRLLSTYNSRLNSQVFKAAFTLSEEALSQDRGAFFTSINGTLNHILVADIIWFSRFVAHSDTYHSLARLSGLTRPSALNEVMYANTRELYSARTTVDNIIEHWVNNELEESDLQRSLVYKNTKGVESKRNFGELLSHVFNHQTHHRGQASTLLFQCGVDIGVTDYLIDIPQAP